MQDNLEKFIKEHKDEFDAHDPPGQLWQHIDKQLRPVRKVRKTYYAVAASLLLLLGLSMWFMQHTIQNKTTQDNTTVVFNPEMKEAELYYTSMVETERTQLSHYGKEFPDVFRDFEGEIDTLHLLYGELKTEYKNSNGNEAVSRALIENLQMQVLLLNKQIQIIQDLQQKESKKSQKNSLM